MASSSTPTPNSINATPPSASQALEFLRVVGKLKTLKRTGWVNNGVTLPESVADHMYRMAMCSFLITDPALDRARLMKLAVVHDLAEALVGDIVPHDVRYTKEQKRVLEEVSEKVGPGLGGGWKGDEEGQAKGNLLNSERKGEFTARMTGRVNLPLYKINPLSTWKKKTLKTKLEAPPHLTQNHNPYLHYLHRRQSRASPGTWATRALAPRLCRCGWSTRTKARPRPASSRILTSEWGEGERQLHRTTEMKNTLIITKSKYSLPFFYYS
jgi:putative hydrolase of HD superfamily